MSKLVRISANSFKMLSQLQDDMGLSIEQIIDRAIYKLTKENTIKKGNEAYATMRQNCEEWQDELKQRAELESTGNDGLNDS